jgi:hypothetical protein
MILPFLVFLPIGSKLFIHPQEPFDTALLVCRVRNHCGVNSTYEQATQLYVASVFEDALRNIKQQLEEVSKRGEDVDKIIHKAIA